MPEPVWRSRPLAATHLAAIVIVASWIFPVSRGWWDQFDLAGFQLLNGSLSLGKWWQTFWATANLRETDLFSGALMLAVIAAWLWGRPREIQNMGIAALGALTLFLGAMPIMMHTSIHYWLGYRRLSPTLEVEGALRLSKLVPAIDAKDVAIASFPGDHAFILTCLALFFWYLGPRRIALAASVLAVIFNLPRLVGGAHWLTDDLIGGVIPAMLVVSWLLATPLGYYMARMFLPLVNIIIAIIPERLRIPDRGAS